MPGVEGPGSLRSEALAAASARFLRWGFAGTSISMIAEDLGVTKAALYYHFPDKEALFLAVFDDYLRGVAADLAAAAPLFELSRGAAAARAAFAALAKVFLSRGEASVRIDRLAFQESPHLSEAGRAVLGQRYHRDLVRPLGECFRLAEEALMIRSPAAGEPARVWLFMGLLSAFFAPGHAAQKSVKEGAIELDAEAEAFARALLDGLGL